MTAEQIQDLITDALVSDDDFQNDFCRNCEAVMRKYGYSWCHCDFNPADRLCVKSQQWGKIAEAIAQVANEAEAPEYIGAWDEQEGYEAQEADRAYEYARDKELIENI